MRIGTNHGSLSERIISRYGNTAQGMVASALEFIQICQKFDFHNIVLSMKASYVKVMVEATRLLVFEMKKRGWDYPIHLGVTEAGNDDEGRIKSAAGIGILLQDGIGDTIRVSLTEAPEKEIPVAKKIAAYRQKGKHSIQTDILDKKIKEDTINTVAYHRRKTSAVHKMGQNHVPVVLASQKSKKADYYFTDSNGISDHQNHVFPVFDSWQMFEKNAENHTSLNFIRFLSPDISCIPFIQQQQNIVLLLDFNNLKDISAERDFIYVLEKHNIQAPIICMKHYNESLEDIALQASSDFSTLLLDSLIDGLCILAQEDQDELVEMSYNILQATGSRISKTEYIACPSCGRTQYNIEASLQAIKACTSHLKGLKIGVMGCIVNGPGEMADADYGYVGESNGKITLYKGKQAIRRNIPEREAIQALVDLIKENGDWIEKQE